MYINVDIPKSDLSDCEINDWVWIFAVGWLQITSTKGLNLYPIEMGDEISCTLDGRISKDDISPSVWDYNPFNSNDYPPESIFAPTKGDRVLVYSNTNDEWFRRYFSYKNVNGYYICYINGCDEWSSEGKTKSWEYCKPVEQEN